MAFATKKIDEVLLPKITTKVPAGQVGQVPQVAEHKPKLVKHVITGQKLPAFDSVEMETGRNCNKFF